MSEYCRQCRRDISIHFDEKGMCDICENWAAELQYWSDIFGGGKVYAEP